MYRECRALLFLWVSSVAGACASPAQVAPPKVAPAVVPEQAPAPAVSAAPAPKSPLPPLDPALPAPPAECARYVVSPPQGEAACTLPAADGLDQALAENDSVLRDQKLALLESCAAFPAGWIRALRADFADAACADAMIEPLLSATPSAPKIDADTQAVLLGLALGARLHRLVSGPPELPQPFDKARFQVYLKEQLEPWVSERAKVIFQLASQGAALRGYGRGVVAVEAAVADLRFVQMARDVPLPEEMKNDVAVRDEYFAALDQALEPRKSRGRDAALAGLLAFAELGVIRSPRIDQARTILSQSYAGHRIDALDGLRLPPLAAADSGSSELRLAARLPTFFAQYWFRDHDVTAAPLLRALLEQGLFPSARTRLEGAILNADVAELYARALFALGQRYWQSKNFEQAASRATLALPQGQLAPEAVRLLAALATALRKGPTDARAMMLGGPLLPSGVGEVKELDALAEGKGELAAMAAYDAAYVLAFLPPTDHVREFWQGIATRYERAARLTRDPALRDDAKSRAQAARLTAAAVREN